MNFQKQKGMALVIGLVMLMLLTIMGISSMSNTTQELKIACNFQNHNDAFQAAMSCVDTAIAQTPPGDMTPDLVNGVAIDVNCVIPGSTTSAVSSVQYLGCRRRENSSLKAGAGLSSENVFDVTTRSVALGCSGQAVSNIVQAVAARTGQECNE